MIAASWILLSSLLAAGTTAPAPAPAAPASKPAAREEAPDNEASIVVTIRHLNGDKEEFRREVDTMELLFDSTGELAVIHLILLNNNEKDTHKFFLFKNLASFAYRFLNVSGKGKVRLQLLSPFTGKPTAEDQPLPTTLQKDYR